ncbi:MAG: dihydropteroate synthase [Gemmataceae bacterium]|nr:dihydropteroate synthase [Gemmataceae bacterium]
MSKVLFVTGRLAESSVRSVTTGIGGIEPIVQVLPITVAALLTTEWAARHLEPIPGLERVILPGYCRGDLTSVSEKLGVIAERGPKDVRDLPDYFGQRRVCPDLTRFDIEIIAEINHAPQLKIGELVATADQMRRDGADVIDLGCDPGTTWPGVGNAVVELRQSGHRVSVDSFSTTEIAAATAAGAELVLSVNSSNVDAAADWGSEVVAIPDDPHSLEGLDATIDKLVRQGVRFRIDPILEPIGCGFAESLGRYLDVRRRYPDAAMMMGIGNLTELTDVDSAGVNMLLAGFCQEAGIFSVLTTQVINWARSSIRELDFARRLSAFAVREQVPPKRISGDLVMLRDPTVRSHGLPWLDELTKSVKDGNYRLFAEDGRLHAIRAGLHDSDTNPYQLFTRLLKQHPDLEASHAFYLGYELANAVIALTLGKQYTQDEALTWGFLKGPDYSRHP